MIQKYRTEDLKYIYHRLFGYFGPQGWWPGRTRFEMIVGAILTQNTAWSNVEKAIDALRRHRLLAPSKINNIKTVKLAALIKPSGYYNIKAKRLQNFTGFLHRKFSGSLNKLSRLDTEDLARILDGVNGIGPETRDSILLYAFRRPVFVVDAYTKRVFLRHGVFKKGVDYETVQRFFTDGLDKKESIFNEFHALIVRLGKEYCKPNPKCLDCPLRNLG